MTAQSTNNQLRTIGIEGALADSGGVQDVAAMRNDEASAEMAPTPAPRSPCLRMFLLVFSSASTL